MARVFNHSTSPALAALVLALSSCGGDAPTSSAPRSTATEGPTATETATPTPPTATAPSAPSPPPDAPAPTPTSTPAGSGEDQPGGAGDEEGARVPVAVTVGSDGTISPKTVYVPAFFALDLEVRNRTGSPLQVTWNASAPKGTFEVGVGKVGTQRVGGLKRGTYFLSIDGAGTVAVAAGVEPGP
jgi:nucleoid-associated protein YgaU